MHRIAVSRTLSCALGTVILGGTLNGAFAQVTAADVVDRSSLRAFVQHARAEAETSVAGGTEREAYIFFDREFRPRGRWRHGAVYLAVNISAGADRGHLLFHATRPDLEGRNMWNFRDRNGLLVLQEIIARAGRDFVEYYFDDPTVSGDEEDGSFKVGYGEQFVAGGRTLLITSGFYPEREVPIAPPLAQLLLAMLLAGGGAYLIRWKP
ncbi:MAG: cache domain-containing protein [Rhodospirillales bacterium]|nr:cache domain-containing protein [Rhodospirillales bacterium]